MVYDNEDLAEALFKINTNQLSQREASKQYGIPRSTLQDRIYGYQPSVKATRGRPTVLSAEEETHIVNWSIEMSKRGLGQTSSQIRLMVKQFLDLSGKQTRFVDNHPHDTWWYGFVKRHENIKVIRPGKLEISRAMACSEENVSKWFIKLAKVMKDAGIESPAQIYNCDESGFCLQHKPNGKVLVESNMKFAYKLTSNSKMQITNLSCIRADGESIPPFLIYPGKSVNPALTLDLPKDSVGYATEKGWINTGAFRFWIEKVFIPNLPAKRKQVLLIFDGHGSHIDYLTSQICKTHGIELFCIPPHTSHLLQPLDIGVFSPMKTAYRKECDDFYNKLNSVSIINVSQSTSKYLDKYSFGKIFCSSYTQSLTTENIINAFETSGIWPINESIIKYQKCEPAKSFVVPQSSNNSTVQPQSSGNSTTDQPLTNSLMSSSNNSIPQSSNNSIPQSSDNSIPQSSDNSIPQSSDNSTMNESSDIDMVITSTPKDIPSMGDSEILACLQNIEKGFTKVQLILYNKRLELGLDAPNDSIYTSWKTLKTGLNEEVEHIKEIIKLTCQRNNTTTPARRAILTLPKIVKKNPKPADNNMDRLHLTSSESLKRLEEDFEKRREKDAQKLLNKAKRESKKEEKKKVDEEKKKKLDEKKKIAEEKKRATEERKKIAEEKKKATEERKKIAEEKKRATEERKKIAEENKRATEEMKRATKERKRATEEKERAAEEIKKIPRFICPMKRKIEYTDQCSTKKTKYT